MWERMYVRAACLEVALEVHFALKKCGYDYFVSMQPGLAMLHIMKRISHTHLQALMRLTLRLRKEEGFSKNFRAFVQELDKETQTFDRHNGAIKYQASGKDDHKDPKDDLMRTPPGRRRVPTGDHRTLHANNSDKGQKPARPVDQLHLGSSSNKRRREVPCCLNPNFGGKHFMNDSPNSSKEEKKQYKRHHHDAKRSC